MKEKVEKVPCENILKLREYKDKHGKVKVVIREYRFTAKRVKQILTEEEIKRCNGCKYNGFCWVSRLLT